MLCLILILVFFFTILLLLFSKDGFLNSEFDIYQKLINEPWLQRTILINYLENKK